MFFLNNVLFKPFGLFMNPLYIMLSFSFECFILYVLLVTLLKNIMKLYKQLKNLISVFIIIIYFNIMFTKSISIYSFIYKVFKFYTHYFKVIPITLSLSIHVINTVKKDLIHIIWLWSMYLCVLLHSVMMASGSRLMCNVWWIHLMNKQLNFSKV